MSFEQYYSIRMENHLEQLWFFQTGRKLWGLSRIRLVLVCKAFSLFTSAGPLQLYKCDTLPAVFHILSLRFWQLVLQFICQFTNTHGHKYRWKCVRHMNAFQKLTFISDRNFQTIFNDIVACCILLLYILKGMNGLQITRKFKPGSARWDIQSTYSQDK